MKRRIQWDPDSGLPEFSPDPRWPARDGLMRTFRTTVVDDEEQVRRYLRAEQQFDTVRAQLSAASDPCWWNHFLPLPVVPPPDPGSMTAPVQLHPRINLRAPEGSCERQRNRRFHRAEQVAQRVAGGTAEPVHRRVEWRATEPLHQQLVEELWDPEDEA